MTQSDIDKLQNLPIKEKIELVKFLWEDIANKQSYKDLPEDHKQILSERLYKIKEGDAKFKSWPEFKKKYQTE